MVVPPGEDPAVGQTPPVLEGFSFDGSPVKIDPADGRAKVVIFVAHWCPHCQREVPLLVQWQRDGLVPSGLDVIGIATSSDPASPNFPPSEWLAREEFPALWPVMADSGEKTAATAMGVSGFPFFVLIDADGKVALRISGEVEMDALTEQINKALGS